MSALPNIEPLTHCELCEFPPAVCEIGYRFLKTVPTPTGVKSVCADCFCQLNGGHEWEIETGGGWDANKRPVYCANCGCDAPSDIADEMHRDAAADLADFASMNDEYLRDQFSALRGR